MQVGKREVPCTHWREAMRISSRRPYEHESANSSMSL